MKFLPEMQYLSIWNQANIYVKSISGLFKEVLWLFKMSQTCMNICVMYDISLTLNNVFTGGQ